MRLVRIFPLISVGLCLVSTAFLMAGTISVPFCIRYDEICPGMNEQRRDANQSLMQKALEPFVAEGLRGIPREAWHVAQLHGHIGVAVDIYQDSRGRAGQHTHEAAAEEPLTKKIVAELKAFRDSILADRSSYCELSLVLTNAVSKVAFEPPASAFLLRDSWPKDAGSNGPLKSTAEILQPSKKDQPAGWPVQLITRVEFKRNSAEFVSDVSFVFLSFHKAEWQVKIKKLSFHSESANSPWKMSDAQK
jgi:hypothetical protein